MSYSAMASQNQKLVSLIVSFSWKQRTASPLFFVKGNQLVTGGFSSQRASNVENDFMMTLW